jgi:V-type H+-transporting ATPase subunit a
MTKCILRDNFVDGEVWVLAAKFEKVKTLLKNLSEGDENRSTANFIDIVDTNIPKPTYIPTNDFLLPFQQIVDTYGIPRYGEINPALFNTITFPFLFGIMFGDIGHGLAVFLFGIYLCVQGESMKKSLEKSARQISRYRYFILLLGFFAFYCGFLYNDFLSIPLPIFGTCYINGENTALKIKDCVYPFGVDPKWHSAKNDLTFINSMKMKIAVIIGVFHMVFGLLLKGLNMIHFKSWVGIIFEFIPQIIFMCILFGYMDIMIFIKWNTDWSKEDHKAPSLLTQLLNIFLKFGSVVNINLNPSKTSHYGVVVNRDIIHKKASMPLSL